MNKYIRIAVWAFLISIVASGLVLTKRAYGAETYKEQLHQFKLLYADLLIKKIQTIHKNVPVVLFLKDGSEVSGIFKGYAPYDDTVWVKTEAHWFSQGYGLNELQDISVSVKEKV